MKFHTSVNKHSDFHTSAVHRYHERKLAVDSINNTRFKDDTFRSPYDATTQLVSLKKYSRRTAADTIQRASSIRHVLSVTLHDVHKIHVLSC